MPDRYITRVLHNPNAHGTVRYRDRLQLLARAMDVRSRSWIDSVLNRHLTFSGNNAFWSDSVLSTCTVAARSPQLGSQYRLAENLNSCCQSLFRMTYDVACVVCVVRRSVYHFFGIKCIIVILNGIRTMRQVCRGRFVAAGRVAVEGRSMKNTPSAAT